MTYEILITAQGSYNLDHKPTAEDIENFKECFLSDLLDGYIQIDSEDFEVEDLEEDE